VPIKPPFWVVALTWVGAIVLLVTGVLVLAAGRDTWNHPGSPQVSHPTKATIEVVKAPVKVVKKHGATHRKLSTTKRVKTVERASSSSGRSETLALATLATGAALLLAGGFAARLTSIKLPGVEMNAAAISGYQAGVKAGSVAGARVAVAAKESGNEDVLEDKEKLVEATDITLRTGLSEAHTNAAIVAALAAMMSVDPTTVTTADDQKLQDAAEAAVQKVSDES